MTQQEEQDRGRTAAAEGLAITYGILQSPQVRDFAALLKRRRESELDTACSLKLTDIERRDALIRWHLINDLLDRPKQDMLSYHAQLGSHAEILLDLNDPVTDTRS